MKKETTKLKRICAAGMAMLVFAAGTNTNMIKAEAKEIVEIAQAKQTHFSKERSNYKYIDKKIGSDIKHSTGLIDEEIEEYLNSQGFFDEEIKNFTEEELDAISQSDTDDIVVYTEYYAVIDDENISEAVTEDELILLEADEVNELIKEEYYDKESKLNDKLNERLNKKEKASNKDFLQMIGIKPVVVYAADTYSIGGIDDKDNYCYLKKSLVAMRSRFYYHTAEGTKKYYYQLVGTMEWTKMPIHRYVDIFSMEWDNLSYETPSADEKLDWKNQGVDLSPKLTRIFDREIFWIDKNSVDKEPYDYSYKKGITKTMTKSGCGKYDNIDLKNNQFYLREDKVVGVVNLMDNKSEAYDDNTVKFTNYTNEKVRIVMYVKRDGDNTGDVYLSWSHAKKSISASASAFVSALISIASKDITSAVFTLADGTEVEIKYSNAGINHNAWTVNFESEVINYK